MTRAPEVIAALAVAALEKQAALAPAAQKEGRADRCSESSSSEATPGWGSAAALPASDTARTSAHSQSSTAVVATAGRPCASAVAETGAGSGVAVQQAIRERAREISIPGTWMGILEIMAFCAMQKRRVVMQVSEGTLDVIGELAPALLDPVAVWPAFPGRLVACRMDHGVWHVASWRDCTHFVASMPLPNTLRLPGKGVVAFMARQGFATLMTQANGDCGVEALLLLSASRRGAAERTALRQRLHDFLRAAGADAAW